MSLKDSIIPLSVLLVYLIKEEWSQIDDDSFSKNWGHKMFQNFLFQMVVLFLCRQKPRNEFLVDTLCHLPHRKLT